MDKSQIFRIMSEYVNRTCASLICIYLQEWLPKLSESYWIDCVYPYLSENQRKRIEKEGVASLGGLDLASLLNVTKNNWYKIRKISMEAPEKQFCIERMQRVRNRWSHFPVDFPPNDEILMDVGTILDFFKYFNISGTIETKQDELLRLKTALENQVDNIQLPKLGDNTNNTEEQSHAIGQNEEVLLIRINNTYYENISSEDLFEMTRGIWKIGIKNCDCWVDMYGFAIAKKKIVGVYKIEMWQPAGTTKYKNRHMKEQDFEGRYEFVGKAAPEKIRKQYIGKIVEGKRSYGSPITCHRICELEFI